MRLLPPATIHYGWIVVAITFGTALASAGVRSAPTVFIHPLEAEFGWSRAAIAGAISINLVLFGLGAPISGRLIERFGPRAIMVGNLILLSLGIAGTVGMTTLWQLNLLWGVVIGLSAGGSSILAATVATRWFVARRGLVVGFLGTATSTGQLIFLPLLMLVIVHLGWRGGSALLALVVLSMLVPVLFWMRDDPSQMGLAPYGGRTAGGQTRPQPDSPPVALPRAIRAPEFWLLAGSFFVCGATSNGLIGTHLIPHSIDHGIPEVTAAATVGVMGGMNFIGTLLSGWLTDRHDPRKLLGLYYSFRGLSLFVLPFVTEFPGLLVFAVLYGLDWLATVPPTVTLTAQCFGRRSVGTVYGWVFFSHQLGAAGIALLGGAIRVWLGDYQVAFLAGGVLCLIGASLALLIRVREPAPVAAAARAAAA